MAFLQALQPIQLQLAAPGLLGFYTGFKTADIGFSLLNVGLLFLQGPLMGNIFSGLLELKCAVIAGIGPEQTAFQLDYTGGHPVQKPTVMRYHQDRAAVAADEILQPFHRIQVQVIGGLVQKQDIRRQSQQAAQVQAGFLPAAEGTDWLLHLCAAYPQPGQYPADVGLTGIAAGSLISLTEAGILFHNTVQPGCIIPHPRLQFPHLLQLGGQGSITGHHRLPGGHILTEVWHLFQATQGKP